MLYSAHIMALTEDSGQDNDSEERRFGKDSNGEIDLLQVVLSSQFASILNSMSQYFQRVFKNADIRLSVSAEKGESIRQ